MIASEFQTNHIEISKVSKSFDSSGRILQDINLNIADVDFVVILGPSGSGKSTLLRLIAGLEDCTSGFIKIHKNENFKKSFVFQEAHLMPWRNLIENVELPLELLSLHKTERKRRAEASLQLVQLRGVDFLYPSQLSGGMKMRGSLARALATEPSLILLDEPFAALDEQTRFKLAEDLRQIWIEKKMTVVFVTHSVQEACFLANRILILSAKPAHVVHDVQIKLPKIRELNLRTTSLFNDELKKIYRLLNSDIGPVI